MFYHSACTVQYVLCRKILLISICSQKEFVRRYQTSEGEKGSIPMLASACPGKCCLRVIYCTCSLSLFPWWMYVSLLLLLLLLLYIGIVNGIVFVFVFIVVVVVFVTAVIIIVSLVVVVVVQL